MSSKAVPTRYSLAARHFGLLCYAILLNCLSQGSAYGRDTELYQAALNTNGLGEGAAEAYQLTLIDTPQLSLPPVSLFDLVSERAQRTQSIGQGQTVYSGGAFVVDMPFEAPALPTFVRREIPSLWRVTVPAGRRVQPLPLRFEWESLSTVGIADNAANDLRPQLFPWIQSERRDELGRTILEGGVWLEIPVQQLRSLQYHGRVVVLLEEY